MSKRNITILGLLAVIAITLGGVGFALADDAADSAPIREGAGLSGLLNGRGFWAQLTEEQRTTLAERTQEMLAFGATHEEIVEMKSAMLQEWGIDAPLWSGPHFGGMGGGHGRQARNGSGSGPQYGGRGSGGQGNDGQCPYTN